MWRRFIWIDTDARDVTYDEIIDAWRETCDEEERTNLD